MASIRTRTRANGGWVPASDDEPKTPMLVREDGLVSFDGERGPWMRILSPAQIKGYDRGEH